MRNDIHERVTISLTKHRLFPCELLQVEKVAHLGQDITAHVFEHRSLNQLLDFVEDVTAVDVG
ncbi:MAG: hypothetical protein V2I33_22640 [Kangiellaceae bacterium]|jgi:hypothetical protein|nr:hypothetical protein [Kangiellaceae bacterium]